DSKTRICSRNDESCALAARKEMEVNVVEEEVTANTVLKPKCNCLPGCSEINYRTYLSSSNIAPEFTFSTDYIADSNLTYFKKNMAIVHLFFVESQYTSHLKGELFGFTEFLSSTGGLLGLFMGFSFMSLVEVVYHITLRLWCAVRKNRRNLHLEQQSNVNMQPAYAIYPFTQ
ncbi:Sodium channel protein Nach, partial [Gryllus bimaculatus]